MITRTSLNPVLAALIATALLAAAPAYSVAPPATGSPAPGSPAPALAVQPAALAPSVQPLPAAGCSWQPALLPAFALQGPEAQPARIAGPACTVETANSPLGRSRPFRGFCACSCTHIPDCNTSADCGGAACLPAITCC